MIYLNRLHKIVATCLCLSILGLSLAGCADRGEADSPSQSSSQPEESSSALIEPNGESLGEEDILFIVESMLPQAREITNLYLGEGLPAKEGEDGFEEKGADYRPVDSLVYPSIHQLQLASEQVFTPQFLASYYASGFEGTVKKPPRYLEKDGVFYVDIAQKGVPTDSEWDTSTMKIVSQGADTIVISMDRGTGDDLENTELTLKCENGNWRFDSAV